MTLFQAFGQFAGQAAVAAPGGMVLIAPSSVDVTGTSATIGANGTVTFTSMTSLSLNDVFSADYDYYVINMRMSQASSSNDLLYRLRVSGTDATGGSDYVTQYAQGAGSSIVQGRTTTSYGFFGGQSSTARSGNTVYLYGPYEAQPTAFRCLNVSGQDNARLYDSLGTHALSTSYTGITLFNSPNAITGVVQVYGVKV